VTAFVVLVCGLLGLLVGSFLNVVIWRVPRKESIVSPPSHCPGCDAPIAPYDNIPVFSWLVLRGRCRHCQTRISIRYPLVELLTAALFVLTALVYHDSWVLPAYLVLSSGLVALSVIDLDLKILPTVIIRVVGAVGAVLLAFASLMEHDWEKFGAALACAAGAFAFFFVLHFVYPRGMGFGDVRLSFVLGLNLGWLGWKYTVGGLFVGFLYGALLGAGVMLAQGAKRGRKVAIPFGPFLAAGTITFILVGAQIIDWYEGLGR
jgi:leader peptidase (prepilin peptidase)/N-methyltransferase